MNRLYCIPSLEQLGDFLEFSEKYQAGFEYNDFYMPDLLDDSAAIQRIIISGYWKRLFKRYASWGIF